MKGQATLEIIIALGLITIVFASVILVISTNQSLSLDGSESSQAIALARENLEIIKALAKLNFSGIKNSSSTQNEFLKEIIVQDINNFTKQVTSRVSWQTDPLRIQKVELPTIITDLETVKSLGGDTGGDGPSGDWKNPRTLGSVDLGPGNSATDLDVKNKFVYITSVASDSKKPDFWIIDATDGQNPIIVSSLNTGTGLESIDVAGDYAYVAGDDDSKELQIIDISNHLSPVVAGTLNLAGGEDALAIFYRSSYVYIGRADGAAQEFQIVDVSNPTSPSLASGLSNVGDEINDIYVYNNRAYIGTEDSSRGMIVIDVSNPSSPSVLGSLNTGAHDYAIYVESESQVSVGGKTKYYIANAATSSNITVIGSSTINNKTRDIAVSSLYAFLATEDSNKEFQVWNISDPARPSFWSSFNFPQVATGVDYEDNIVYVSVRSNDALRIITSGP